MLCGGLTVFSPLKRHGAGKGKKVGVIGLGGLGVSSQFRQCIPATSTYFCFFLTAFCRTY